MKMRIPLSLIGLALLIQVGKPVALQGQSLQFTNFQRLSNREVALALSAAPGRAYRLEVSTNATDWNGLITFATNVVSSLQHTDSAAPYFPIRYYRARQLTGMNNFSGDHLTTTNGDVIIHPVDHASFVLQWDNLWIYNDPVGGSYAGIPKADLILISHTHSDHFNQTTLAGVWKTNSIFIAPQAVYNSMSGSFRNVTIVLTNGAATNVLGLSVEAVPAYNDNHGVGAGNGYVLTLGGKRLYMSGDTGDQPELRALTNIDVAFICINQPFTMTVNDAINLVTAMRPKAVYPYHYRDQWGTTTNAAAFKQRLNPALGVEVRLRKWY